MLRNRLIVGMVLVALSVVTSSQAIPLDGLILITGLDEVSGSFCYFMDGASDVIVPAQTHFDVGNISPDTMKVAYNVRTNNGWFHANTGDIWVANRDGSKAANLTGPYGLGGVNCVPMWSPDGSMIAFQHSVPAAGQRTCEAGFQIWLMNADGSNLHPWLSSPSHFTWWPSWEPDGYRLRGAAIGLSCFTADITGMNITMLPNVIGGKQEQWSKDGSKLSYIEMRSDVVEGEPGVWRKLVLANADGSNKQTLVQRFIKDADIEAHIAKYNFQPADTPWYEVIQSEVGPSWGRWSSMGDQLVFTAALPFDPNGNEFTYQVETWLYDISSQQIIQLTQNSAYEAVWSWGGPNTTSYSPTVTVNNTNVTFSHVNIDGWTSIIRTEDFPSLPVPYIRVGKFYRINTTAQVTGPAIINMSYSEGDIASTAEIHLAILKYNETQEQWQDITISRDIMQNIIMGESNSLGLIGLTLPLPSSQFLDVPSSASNPYWALWEIEAAYAAGIVNGYPDGNYQPTNPVTRDQMAVFISRAMAEGDANVPEGPAEATFSDVPNTGFGPDGTQPYWAYKYIEYAAANDVVMGFPEGDYKPSLALDRGQMAVFIARAIATPTGEAGMANYTPPTNPTFPDVTSSNDWSWAYKYVEYIADPARVITQGYDDGLYHPERTCTRDQMAVYIQRAFQLPI